MTGSTLTARVRAAVAVVAPVVLGLLALAAWPGPASGRDHHGHHGGHHGPTDLLCR